MMVGRSANLLILCDLCASAVLFSDDYGPTIDVPHAFAMSLIASVPACFRTAPTSGMLPPGSACHTYVTRVFVPSGGSKWVIEAPYVMAAAHELKVHLGWVVTSYDLGEALANLVQPFWMLPTLAILGLRARDVMGYTFVVFLGLTPVVLLLVTLLGRTLDYPF